MITIPEIRKPRCFMVYAIAPDGVSASEANRLFNLYVADPTLPLVLFHDHFIGRRGGVAIFYAETPQERESLSHCDILNGWQIEIHPLIFSHSPAAFDEQIAYTLRAYRNQDWEQLQQEKRPAYGDPMREAETGEEL